MKFLVFSDLHRDPGISPGGTYDDLRLFERRALEEKCDFIIHAGDFCDKQKKELDYIETYNNLRVPTYHCLGNHDGDSVTFEEAVSIYRMPHEYYYFDKGGYRFIVLNNNYFLEDGVYHHYSLANYFGKNRAHIPPDQLAWLEETIASSNHPCVLISHRSFERPDGIKNRQEVLDIINAANKKRAHSVLLCINGHYHRDYIRILDGVCYFDLNSASFECLAKKHDLYPEEFCREYKNACWGLVFNDPLHAVIELEGTTIDIQGMESSFYMGVDSIMSGNPLCDAAGRPNYPRVQTARITL